MKKHDWASGDVNLPRRFVGVFRYSRRALELVWSTRRDLALTLAVLTLVAGVLPAAVAWVGQPTATMDARAEAVLYEHFRELCRGKMTILISHRFSTVRMAAQTLVLREGRVVEQGSHQQLMALGGQYAQLFTLQARGYQ